MQVLVLESSSSAAKALLYDSEKGVLGLESRNFGKDIDAGGLHDADRVFESTLDLGRQLAEGRAVEAVGLVGVWHSILTCHDSGLPDGPTFLWNFPGTAEICRRIRNRHEFTHEIYRRTGCMPNMTYAPYALLYRKEHGGDFTNKRLMSQAGYHFHRLTGEYLESRCIVSGMGLLDLHTLDYDPVILELCGIRADQLGTLVDYRSTRPLSREMAGRLGITPGIPVVPPHPDGALNHIGSGAHRPGWMTFSVGTSAAIRLTTEQPVLTDPPSTWCYLGVDRYLAGAATNGACNCINWLKETLLEDRWSFDRLAEDLLDPLRSTPVFLPFLFGERCPGWDDTRRGGFHGLKGEHCATDLFRAVSEGVLFNVFQCYEKLVDRAGEPQRILLSGGIANSLKWAQMAADIFQRPLHVSQQSQASLLGGAALALTATGELEDPDDFRASPSTIVKPRPEAEAVYREKYRRYLEAYGEETSESESTETMI